MVTFRLIEETGQYLTYWYFPNGNEDEMYGIILIDKLNETVEIQKMAHDDFSHIAIQVILNVMVVTNMMPNTGITLPFISYGGTSILFLMIEMGLALGISRRIKLEG